jgi:hypothetical protein
MKAFMLFLIYTGVMLVIAGAAAFCRAFIDFAWANIIWALVGAAAVVGALMVAGFGCSYIPQVCVNRTTLERIARVPEGTFDSGRAENFRQIFGTCAFAWFFPTRPPISGFAWSGIQDLDNIQTGDLAAPLRGDSQPQATAPDPPANLSQTAAEP